MYDWNYSTCSGATVYNIYTGEIFAQGLTRKEAKILCRKLNA